MGLGIVGDIEFITQWRPRNYGKKKVSTHTWGLAHGEVLGWRCAAVKGFGA